MSSTIDEIKSAPQTFSSWDSCMQKNYCKLPAIIGIVIGVLVAASIIWCCVRCCCCGMSCCCGCFSCFNRCCPSGRGRKQKTKYAEPPPAGYPLPNPYMGYIPPTNPPTYQGPNTATFDVPGQKANPDALPAMPTWADAKVEPSHHRDDVELGHMIQPGQTSGVVPIAAGRTSKGGYRELPHQDDTGMVQPRGYRGATSTHPYGSDLGAQGMMVQQTAYDPPQAQPQTDRFQSGVAAPAPYARSSPQPAYTAYSPSVGSSSGQARPPSLLQIGRRPV
jgi:hypothetical protein